MQDEAVKNYKAGAPVLGSAPAQTANTEDDDGEGVGSVSWLHQLGCRAHWPPGTKRPDHVVCHTTHARMPGADEPAEEGSSRGTQEDDDDADEQQ